MGQFLLLTLTGAAIWFIGEGQTEIGGLCGALSAPFWIYSAWKSKLWGIQILNFWFLFNYLKMFFGG